MKIVYTNFGRIEIDDRSISLAKKAREVVQKVSRDDWSPSIEIDIDFDIFIKIYEDFGFGGFDEASDLLKSTDDPRIKTGLFVYYQYPEGIESIIDDNDLLKLPNVYFNDQFKVHLSALTCEVPPLDHIKKITEKPYWKSFALEIYSRMKKEMKDVKKNGEVAFEPYEIPKILAFQNKVMSSALDFYRGSMSFSSFLNVLKSKDSLIDFLYRNKE